MTYTTCPNCGGRLILMSPGVNDECICDTCEFEIDHSGIRRSIVTSIRKETVMTKVTIEGEITKPVEEASQVLREFLMKFYEQKNIPENNDTKKISAAIDFADSVKMDLVNWVLDNTRFL